MEAVLNRPFNSAQIELIQLLAQDLDNEELMESDCTKYAIQKMIVSQQKGLIEYESNTGEKWKKIN